VHVLEGRGLTAADTWDAPRVAVVSRSLALREFQDGEAIGRHIQVGDDGTHWATVVGVVEDTAPVGFGGSLQPRYAVYVSILQHPPDSAELLIRAPPGRSLGSGVGPILKTMLGASGLSANWRHESSLLLSQAAPVAWFGQWFAVEGWAMLGLALLGAFALMGIWVQSLLGELGIRRAVGARRRDLVRFVVVRALGVGLAGVAIGLWFAPGIWSMLPAAMGARETWDTGVVARFAVLLVGSTLAGALLPAWRAATVNPTDALRL
jgi:hypothetical protein